MANASIYGPVCLPGICPSLVLELISALGVPMRWNLLSQQMIHGWQEWYLAAGWFSFSPNYTRVWVKASAGCAVLKHFGVFFFTVTSYLPNIKEHVVFYTAVY